MATKAVKQETIEELKGKFSNAKIALISNFEGLTVSQITNLRRQLQKQGGDLTVVKNTLAKKAVDGSPYEEISSYLVGSSAVAFGYQDEISPAKVLVDFGKDLKKEKKDFTIKGGLLEGKLLNKTDVESLAQIPSKEELYAKMLGSLNAPASQITMSINAVIQKLVLTVEAVRQAKEKAAG